jgi:saccharopine dehydrogenase-like NADP-dependent oxidoreductase
VSSVLLVGTGQVGIRAARQLADSPGLSRLWVASRDGDRAAELAAIMGRVAEPNPTDAVHVPDGVAVVAIASNRADRVAWVRAALGVGASVVSTDDDDLGELDAAARAAHATVVGGCGLAPGLSDVLVRHAADALAAVDDVHVARVGASGAACVEAVRDARRETPGEWRDGSWRANRSFGSELVWFPDPIGARECQLVREGITATVTTVPTARHVTVRYGAPPSSRRFTSKLRRDPLDGGWGATRVEVNGSRAGTRESLVYGVVDRMPVVAGTVLALAAVHLAGLGGPAATRPVGVRALGEVVTPVPFLTELAHRGVKAAAFDGVAPAA